MGGVILFCRAVPFLFFRGTGEADKRGKAFLDFVEKTVPPAAMTVLTFNFIAAPVNENPREAVPVLVSAAMTALIHLWKRNPLLSIFGGTALYMILERIIL
jgi:branched-subunit amino acid transport protein AzlD